MENCKICKKEPIKAKEMCHKCYMKEYRKKKGKQLYEKYKEKYKLYYKENRKRLIFQTNKYAKEHPFQTKYYNVKGNAERRNIQFNISKVDFLNIIKKYKGNCEYCGVKTIISKKWDLKTMSIDRKDNNKGYSKGNIVICCYLCNSIKHKIFTFEDMKCIIGPLIKERRKINNGIK